jgi:hypothetical protein
LLLLLLLALLLLLQAQYAPGSCMRVVRAPCWLLTDAAAPHWGTHMFAAFRCMWYSCAEQPPATCCWTLQARGSLQALPGTPLCSAPRMYGAVLAAVHQNGLCHTRERLRLLLL